MPIRQWIEKDKRRIRAEVYKEFSLDDIVTAIQNSVDDPDYEPGFDVLSDHIKVQKPITTDQLKRMIFKLRQLSKKLAGSRWAVVVRLDRSKSMMMMLSENIKRVPMTLRVFQTIEEAEEWLQGNKTT